MALKLEDITFKKKNFTPGPGNYEIHERKNNQHANSPRFSMGTEKRCRDLMYSENKCKPGAGTYN
jgi:hypothetical protein